MQPDPHDPFPEHEHEDDNADPAGEKMACDGTIDDEDDSIRDMLKGMKAMGEADLMKFMKAVFEIGAMKRFRARHRGRRPRGANKCYSRANPLQ